MASAQSPQRHSRCCCRSRPDAEESRRRMKAGVWPRTRLSLLVANLEQPVLAASRQAPATEAQVSRAVTRVLKIARGCVGRLSRSLQSQPPRMLPSARSLSRLRHVAPRDRIGDVGRVREDRRRTIATPQRNRPGPPPGSIRGRSFARIHRWTPYARGMGVSAPVDRGAARARPPTAQRDVGAVCLRTRTHVRLPHGHQGECRSTLSPVAGASVAGVAVGHGGVGGWVCGGGEVWIGFGVLALVLVASKVDVRIDRLAVLFP